MTALSMLTLLLHPENSPFIPVPLIAELQSLAPDSRLQVFRGTRHGLPFSHADKFAWLCWGFLETLRENLKPTQYPQPPVRPQKAR
mgnify:CR=1 FL=1